MRLLVFDLDGTLAELGKGIEEHHVAMLQELENRGMRIALCSGKPTYYLCGFMRQVGLKAPILVGENGAVIQFGIDLPPVRYARVPYEREADHSLLRIREAIELRFPHIWFQPNEVALTPFPRTEEEFDWIQRLLDQNQFPGVDVYRHCDSFDLVPAGVDKYAGLRYLGRILGVSAEDTIAVGDGVNDYPMFAYAGLSLGVHVRDAEKVDENFANITEVLTFLLERYPEK